MLINFLPKELRKFFLMPRRQRQHELRLSLWSKALVYIAAAAALAIITLAIETQFDLSEYFSFFIFNFDTAQLLTSTLVGSVLLLIAYTLNVLLVVLTTFSGQFSPRMLQDFVSSKQTQHFIGIFNGGFIYVLCIFVFVNNLQTDEFTLVPIVTAGVMFTVAMTFLFFINHAIHWMKVHNITWNMRRISEDIIENSLEEAMEKLKTSEAGDLKESYRQNEKTVEIAVAGYIQLVDFEGLVNAAQKDDVVIALSERVGDFLLAGNPLFSYWGPGVEAVDEKAYKNCFLIGSKETEIQDSYLSMSKIAEVAIKSINNGDPRSAINAIYQLAGLMQTIDKQILFTPYLADADGQVRVITQQQEFVNALYRGFGMIRHYSKGDLPIIMEMVAALQMLAKSSGTIRHTDIWGFVENTIENIPQNIIYDIDSNRLFKELHRLSVTTGNEMKYEKLKKAIEQKYA